MKILVFEKVYVPGYGMGPFITPIEVNDLELLAEIKRKSRIKIIDDNKKVSRRIQKNNSDYPIHVEEQVELEEKIVPIKEVVPEVIEEEVTETVEEQPEIEENEEVVPEVIEEEVTETVEEQPEIEENLEDKTVSELKTILDEMGVSYLYKDTKNVLIEKIKANR